MGWFVRYIDDELKHEMVSRELFTEEEALEEAWNLAQGDNEIVGIDGPDEEAVPMLEIEAWFEQRSAAGKTEPSP
ncbi:MAG: hypothetical protein WBV25_11970 [Methylocella sp.]|jgi:hypothetical protein